jgi:hypothetical protein
MRADVLEETIRLEIEQQAEKFGVNYYELSPNVQSWLRSLVIAQLYGRDRESDRQPGDRRRGTNCTSSQAPLDILAVTLPSY